MLKEKTAVLVNKAFRLRYQNIGWKVTFVKPGGTLSVSMTGEKCNQGCSHCEGRYLKAMTDISLVSSKPEKYRDKYKSILISGGFLEDMRLPIAEHAKEIRRLKQAGFRLNFHVQRVNGEDIDVIKNYADCVSIDYIASKKIIEEVYKSPSYEPIQTIDTILNLRDSVKVVPHITLGLDRGKIDSEYKGLEDLKKADIDYLVLNIIRPGKNTEFESINIPSNQEILRFLCAARIKFPYISISLGCMRPGGSLRIKIDNMALLAGLNTIVNPLTMSMEYAVSLGLEPDFYEECCALGILIY